MSLSVGIVGLPNVGKSTLFNALAARRLAETDIRPFTTIEPHEAVVAVSDENLGKLADVVAKSTPGETVATPGVSRPRVMPATVTFIDIAGLVKGAHQGEGLGNQFLAKIREVDAVVHVVRAFENPNVVHVHGKIDPIEDIEVVNLELALGGITGKPTIYVLNTDESKVSQVDELIKSIRDKFGGEMVVISAKLEEEVIDLDQGERGEYLNSAGVSQSGLNQLVKSAYRLLGLITFYTIKGGKEVHAWSLKSGSKAIEAAGVVHTDFGKNFIKAEVVNVDRLLEAGGWRQVRENGWVSLEGRDYVMQAGDVVEFKVGI